MEFYARQNVNTADPRSGRVQCHVSNCPAGGPQPTRSHQFGRHLRVGIDGPYNRDDKMATRPPRLYSQYSTGGTVLYTVPEDTTYRSDSVDEGMPTVSRTSIRCGMSWTLIALVVFMPIAFLITFIAAWQLGHIDPILPFISDTGANLPESGIFAELLNIGALCVVLVTYVRYRQVAHYLYTSQSRRSERVNKAAFGFGLLVAFGITLVANFPSSSMTVVNILHIVGALMAFGVACVYLWLQVALSFITLHRLSPLVVCITRVLLAVVATIAFPVNEVFNNPAVGWKDAGAACQWVTLTSIVLFLVSFFDEFRYITVKPKVKVTDRQFTIFP